MLNRHLFVGVLVAAVACVGLWSDRTIGADKPGDKAKPAEAKTGSAVGLVTAKEEKGNWIEVKADGEEKARRYVPAWVGGAPAQGGGFNKTTVQSIKDTPLNVRVKLDWTFDERARVVKIEVLRKEEKKEDKK